MRNTVCTFGREEKQSVIHKTELHCGNLEAEVIFLRKWTGCWKDPVDAVYTGGLYGQKKKKRKRKFSHSVLKSHMHADNSNSQHNGVPLQAKDTEGGRFQAI